MTFACFGDSITAGKPGFSFCTNLRKKASCMNFGLGGETVLGLLKRIPQYIPQITDQNIIIEIGANDILLPFLEKYSDTWNKQVHRIYNRGSIPCENMKEFSNKFSCVIDYFNTNKICVISIPCIGEQLDNSLNKKADRYNTVIMDICTNNKISFINFNRLQKEQINNIQKNRNHYFLKKDPSFVVLDTLLTSYFGISKFICKKRDLLTTIDGIHLSKESSKILADLIITQHSSRNHGS